MIAWKVNLTFFWNILHRLKSAFMVFSSLHRPHCTGCKGSIEMSSKVGFWDVIRQCHDLASEVREGSQEAVLEHELYSSSGWSFWAQVQPPEALPWPLRSCHATDAWCLKIQFLMTFLWNPCKWSTSTVIGNNLHLKNSKNVDFLACFEAISTTSLNYTFFGF